MKPFIIYTYDYNPGVGGIKVMHKLCHLLNTNGYTSYLMPIHINENFYTCADYNTPLITQEVLDNLDDTIVVYPEGIKQNPLNAKNVVRWILGPSNPGDYNTYAPSDIVYWYMDYYFTEAVGQRENQLFISEYHDDIFTNVGYSRSGSCYSIRKASPIQKIHPQDSIEIPFNAAGNLPALSELFNTTTKFYCYDNYTFLYIQAAMCGCISVVIPDGKKSKEEWLDGSPLHKYGIAYGEEDIPRAIETLPLLFQEIDNQKNLMIKQTLEFADNCNNLFI